jgi:hypothetical protein
MLASPEKRRKAAGASFNAALVESSKIGEECTGRPLSQQDEPGTLELVSQLAFTVSRGRC